MRGEYEDYLATPRGLVELPPRARRIHFAGLDRLVHVGTTSACAENTRRDRWRVETHRNYLRVRGEYSENDTHGMPYMELPPRARRIPTSRPSISRVNGTTSACAENTLLNGHLHSFMWNYLRVRGEYSRSFQESNSSMELPPRARRIRHR